MQNYSHEEDCTKFTNVMFDNKKWAHEVFFKTNVILRYTVEYNITQNIFGNT